MDGISSIKMMQGGPDYASKSHMIKWTEVFILPSSKECTENNDYNEPPDPSRITSHIAKAISMALLPHLKQLKKEDLSPLAVKVCLDPETDGANEAEEVVMKEWDGDGKEGCVVE